MGHNKVETDLFSTDTLAFLLGFKGHITPVMRDFAANAKRGAVGNEAASQKNHANSLVKVSPTDRYMHPTNVSVGTCLHVHGSNPVPQYLCMMFPLVSRGFCIPVALCGRCTWQLACLSGQRRTVIIARSGLRKCLSLWLGILTRSNGSGGLPHQRSCLSVMLTCCCMHRCLSLWLGMLGMLH